MKFENKEFLRYRILQALIYLSFAGVAVIGLFELPSAFAMIVGSMLAKVCSVFALIATLVGIVSVLTGLDWLERVAIISAATALLMYICSIAVAPIVTLGLWFALGFLFALVKRFVEITFHTRKQSR